MLVQFLRNSDNKTTTLLIDHKIMEDEIPYVPEHCMDHRGFYLWLLCGYMDDAICWDDFEFGEETENLDEIKRGFDYMSSPFYIKRGIELREKGVRNIGFA